MLIEVQLGGDGTVLYASWLFQKVVPPVLSFALGSLGFLTKFDFEEYQKILSTAFQDGVTISLRLRFEATVMRTQFNGEGRQPELVEELVGEECDNNYTHKPAGTYEVLNDIVVDRGPNPSTCNRHRESVYAERQQPCLQLRFSGMTNTLPPYRPTVFV